MMQWYATRFGFGLIVLNIVVLMFGYKAGAPDNLATLVRQALFALPLLLSIDLARYALHCWRSDCLAD